MNLDFFHDVKENKNTIFFQYYRLFYENLIN